ncbi:MAG: hypothetical protein ABW298_10695 [Candidatus Binatia bacterium]
MRAAFSHRRIEALHPVRSRRDARSIAYTLHRNLQRLTGALLLGQPLVEEEDLSTGAIEGLRENMQLFRRARRGHETLDLLLEGCPVLPFDVELALQGRDESLVAPADGGGGRGGARRCVGLILLAVGARLSRRSAAWLRRSAELLDTALGGFELALPFEQLAAMGG